MNIKIKRFIESLLAGCSVSMPRKLELMRDPLFQRIYTLCKPYTLTPVERMYALYQATVHISKQGIAGDMVECGVWRGGSSMIMARTLRELGDTERTIYLYDTYAGMSEPTDKDVNFGHAAARSEWNRSQKATFNQWCYCPIEEVKAHMDLTGYPADKIKLIKGKVETTIPATVPEKIALLRLDTDWYESTKHELEHLFPKLCAHGILIMDDVGEWQGAKDAVREYFEKNQVRMLLNRTDYSGRIGVKI
ncbi:MAG: TylF/MycF/NovP-related O-methyltransferase [Candidatus Omnitrophota bacterium]|nr:TylF/MycF/NovP-related O-methyltransferase [Candidatus Omnitrophota bacterium]